MATLVVAQLLFLEAENPKKEISMYINSPGGVVTSGMAIYDTMQFIKPAVSTLCIGQAASMGSLLLCAGAKDMRFATPQGFNTGEHFYQYLKDSFDCLYEEGRRGSPKMMSIGLHCRLVGRPGRALGLAKFIDYIQSKDKVWIARRIDIAKHLHRTFG